MRYKCLLQPRESSRELLELETGAEDKALAGEAASQGGTATDSDDDSLVAYDLKESDEEGVKSPSFFQKSMFVYSDISMARFGTHASC